VIDVAQHRIDLMVEEAELAQRSIVVPSFVPRYRTGVLEKFARLTQGAHKGAVTSA
jgi:dihydroxy-acid dehydratase